MAAKIFLEGESLCLADKIVAGVSKARDSEIFGVILFGWSPELNQYCTDFLFDIDFTFVDLKPIRNTRVKIAVLETIMGNEDFYVHIEAKKLLSGFKLNVRLNEMDVSATYIEVS